MHVCLHAFYHTVLAWTELAALHHDNLVSLSVCWLDGCHLWYSDIWMPLRDTVACIQKRGARGLNTVPVCTCFCSHIRIPYVTQRFQFTTLTHEQMRPRQHMEAASYSSLEITIACCQVFTTTNHVVWLTWRSVVYHRGCYVYSTSERHTDTALYSIVWLLKDAHEGCKKKKKTQIKPI